jgi:acetyl esterase/lipase
MPPGGKGVDIALRVEEHSSNPNAFHDRVVTGIARPALCVFPAASPNGSALLIAPGGGYRELRVDKEGFEVAQRFSEAGVTSFVLLYRLPREGWRTRSNTSLQDAQRAMRLIRANATRFAIDPDRVGVLGFSAGGHLAASLSVRSDALLYDAIDAADKYDARPSLAALLYPVITMLGPHAHEASCEMLLGGRATRAMRKAWSCERLVTRNTPPTFLAAAADDPDVSPENTLEMFTALRRPAVPAEMHLFERGGHGFGLATAAGAPVASWPDLLLRWGAAHWHLR